MAGPQFIPFIPKSPKFLNRAGIRYGRLVALEPLLRADDKNKFVRWRCICDCGAETIVVATLLNNGKAKSCGCLRSEMVSDKNRTHGHSKSRTYNSWMAMRSRCDNSNATAYENYGGRGITYDPRWQSFESFLADMGDAPGDLEIERIDNNGNYCKANCRWATMKEQANNKRNTLLIEYKSTTMTVTALARIVGMPRKLLYVRLWSGWSVNDAVRLPPHRKRFYRKPIA